ncbi:MAG TPA: sugar phosphate isomerase/epimerase [Gemmatimonadaceae bacterium]|nr:sugar phosphate isomerase/epimerase [Gemmatimonadaceae bacterium]
MDRRAFITAAGGVVAAGLAPLARVSAASHELREPRRRDVIGLQLYTVRREMAQDVERTLQRVAEMGYREVEFAGYFDHSPAEVRAMLARHGLRSPASHVPYERIERDWAAALDEAAAVGHEWVVVPWLDAKRLTTVDDWRRVAERLGAAGVAARAAGLRLGYHNHDFEFRPVEGAEGRVPLDLLLADTDPESVDFELDLYWMVRAGHDPLAWYARHPGRFRLAHVKDSAGAPEHRMVDVGRGTIDFVRILPAAARAGTTHFFVEHDDPADPLASARASIAYLARLDF